MLGLGAVEGLVVAKVLFFDGSAPDFTNATPKGPDVELARLAQAIEVVEAQLSGIIVRVAAKFDDDKAYIFDYQLLLLRDEDFLGKTHARIHGGDSAETAVDAVCREYMKLFSEMDNRYLCQRATDMDDVRTRLLCALQGKEYASLEEISEDVVLAADDLTPSQTIGINGMVKGILLGKGGSSSHTVVLARSMGIPCIVGLTGMLDQLPRDKAIIMDGKTGEVFTDPTETLIEDYQRKIQANEDSRKMMERYRFIDVATLDGFPMSVLVNMADKAEIAALTDAGAGGVGLLRTEFFYMASDRPPTEEEQYIAYREIAIALDGKPLTIRTLDAGGDKHIAYLGIPSEENPYLGYRAIRYCLDNEALFKSQIAAVLRAARHGHVRMMFPMIATVTELRRAKAVVAAVQAELDARGEPYRKVPVGIMVETPSAACMADALAREADFFSIGTNDLTQYMLAADRGNGKVAHLNSHFDPALLRAVNWVCKAAAAAGIDVDICGQAGEVSELVPLWAAMGVNGLSVSMPSVPRIKKIISETDRRDAGRLLEEALRMPCADEVAGILERFQENRTG
jgi:phosphotransferase system enzyme I (PtsI)